MILREVAVLAGASCIVAASLLRGAEDSPAPPIERQTRNFDIRFLTEEIPDFDCRSGPPPVGLWVRLPDEEVEEGEGPGGGTFTFGEEAGLGLSLGESAAASPWTRIAPSALVDLIKANIAEDSWANSRNSIDADERTLTCRQTPEVLERIELLLAQLRARRARMIAIEVAVVPAAALGGRAANDPPWLSSEEFDQVVARAGAGATKLSLTAYDGQLVSAHSGDRRTVIADFDVNQTGVSPVINPLTTTVQLGVVAAIRPRSIATTEWFFLTLDIAKRWCDGEPQKLEGPFGQYETSVIAEAQFETDLNVRAGGGAVAGILEGSADGVPALAAIVRARPFSLEAAAPRTDQPTEEFVTRLYDIEFVLRRAGTSMSPLARLPASPEDVETCIRRTILPDSWQDSRAAISVDRTQLTVRNRLPVHERLHGLLDGWIRDGACLVAAETWTLGGTSAQLEPLLALCAAGGRLPEDWEARARAAGLAVTSHVRQNGLLGTQLHCHGMKSRTYVADYECVSGGTSFTLTDCPDPISRVAGSGLELRWSVRPLPATAAEVELDTKLARTRFENTGTFFAPWKLSKSNVVRPPVGRALKDGAADEGKEEPEGDDGDSGDGPSPPGEDLEDLLNLPAARDIEVFVPVTIDLPEQQAWSFDRSILVPWDAPVVIEVRSDPAGEPPATARIVRVKQWQGMAK